MAFDVLTELPVFPQEEYYQLAPKIEGGILPENQYLQIAQSSFYNAEREFILATFATVAARSGVWQPLDQKTFGVVLFQNAPTLQSSKVSAALLDLCEKGYLLPVRVASDSDRMVLVPTPAFSKILAEPYIIIQIGKIFTRAKQDTFEEEEPAIPASSFPWKKTLVVLAIFLAATFLLGKLYQQYTK